MSAREKFAEWERRMGTGAEHLVQRGPDDYAHENVTWRWHAWRTAWLAAKADDAEICESLLDGAWPPGGHDNARNFWLKAASAAIRASDAIDGAAS